MPFDQPSDSRLRILVVDDDPDVRDVVAEYLEVRGYNVLQAADGAEALQKLEADPSLRLIISDVRMPGVSGLELAAQAAERHPDVRIILISGYFHAQAVGPRFLKKPFSMDQLESVMRDELQSQAMG